MSSFPLPCNLIIVNKFYSFIVKPVVVCYSQISIKYYHLLLQVDITIMTTHCDIICHSYF